MMYCWELILKYIRLTIEASDLPKWGHYEITNNDLSDKEKEKWKK